MSEKNKAIVRRYFKAVSDDDQRGLDEVLDPELVVEFPGSDEPIRGREAFKQLLRVYREASPDLKVEVTDVVAEGEKVAVRWTARYKHAGPFGEHRPSGKEGAISGLDLIRIRGDKIVEINDQVDLAAAERQLGFSPTLPGGRPQ